MAIRAQDFGTTNIEINVTGGTPGNDRQVPADVKLVEVKCVPTVFERRGHGF